MQASLKGLPNSMVAAIMETTDDYIFFKDTHHILLAASQSMVGLCAPITHWTQFPAKSDYDVFPEPLADEYYELETRVYSNKAMARELQPVMHRDGRRGWVDNRKYPIFDEAGSLIGLYGVARDVTAQVETLRVQSLAASVFENSAESIAILDPDGLIVDVNQPFEQLTGTERERLPGTHLSAVLRQTDGYLASFHERWETLQRDGFWQGEISIEDKRGIRREAQCRMSAVRDDHGDTHHYVAMYSDISALKTHERELERIAQYDLLTGLPNRNLFTDRMLQAIARCERNHTHMAVAYIDIDGFKQINDQLGHAAGDNYLSQLGEKMRHALRETDTIARIGGDEFVALIPDLEHADEFEPITSRLLDAASSRLKIGGESVQCSASIGVARYPLDGLNADLLIRRADQVMYQAKQQGKNRLLTFAHSQRAGSEAREDLQRALARGEFELFYQPKVNMATGQVLGLEALARWNHQQRGFLNPIEFLPLIERENLLTEFGAWVIEQSFTQLREWAGKRLTLSLSINVAGVQLQQDGFLDSVLERARAFALQHPLGIELEVLETSALNDLARIAALMRHGQTLGLSFALDDFGTGFSSLTHLRRLPVKSVKIDRSFVQNMLVSPEDHAIVSSIIGLCQGLGREVIAEGVSSPSHARELLRMGCFNGQGYAIAKPMPAEEIPQWLLAWEQSPLTERFSEPVSEPADQQRSLAAR
jgi:diguanylate cyclase (GGDEF)-like protein/PAS domain S-box-containing protein